VLRKLLLVVALAFFSMTAEARHGATTLLDPPPLAIPAGVTAVDVEKSILTSGIKRNWTVVDKKPGAIVLQYAAREFWVKVTVKYDAHAVSIGYLDSSNLEYSNSGGAAMIHPNYNRWVNNLAHDIDGDMAVRMAK
jgi:hypothetical protein